MRNAIGHPTTTSSGWAILGVCVLLALRASPSAAQWGFPTRNQVSPFAADPLADPLPASRLPAGAVPTRGSLDPGQRSTYEFSVLITQQSYSLTVSPCKSDGDLDWEISRANEVIFQHTPSRKFKHNSRGVPWNVTEPHAARLFNGYGSRTARGRRQVPLASDFAHPAEKQVGGGGSLGAPAPSRDLPISAVTHEARDAMPGEYLVTVGNHGAEAAEFTVQLLVGFQGASPALPAEPSVVLKGIRPTQVTLEWQSVVSASPVEYCLEYAIGDQLRKSDIMNTACGVARINARHRNAPAAGAAGRAASRGPARQCTRSTQLTARNLFPDTTYVLNIMARDLRSRDEVAYRGAVVTTISEGIALADGKEQSGFTLFPRSKQAFTFDLMGQVTPGQLVTMRQSKRPLRISVVPCHGRVTWEVSKDGVPSQYISPHYFDLDAPVSGYGSDSEEDSYSGQSTSRRPAAKFRRDTEPTYAPVRPHRFQEDGDYYGFQGNQHRDIVRPRPRADAGLGVSTGMTTYVYRDAVDRADSVYQISVYNLDPRTEASFNIRAELLSGEQRPLLPPDPQVRVKGVTSKQVQVNFVDSAAPPAATVSGKRKMKYCAVAQPRSELKPFTVLSSECNIRSRIPGEVLTGLQPRRPQMPQLPGRPHRPGQPGLGMLPGQPQVPRPNAPRAPAAGRPAPSPGAQPKPNLFPGPGAQPKPNPFPGPGAQPKPNPFPGPGGVPNLQLADVGSNQQVTEERGRSNAANPGWSGGRQAVQPAPRRPLGNSPFGQPASSKAAERRPFAADNRQTAAGTSEKGNAVRPGDPFVQRNPGSDKPFDKGNPLPDFFSPNEVLVRPMVNPFDTMPAMESSSPFAQAADSPDARMQSTLSVQSMRMTCGESTHPVLRNLKASTEYAVEVLAIDAESLNAVAYTSALFRTDEAAVEITSGTAHALPRVTRLTGSAMTLLAAALVLFM